MSFRPYIFCLVFALSATATAASEHERFEGTGFCGAMRLEETADQLDWMAEWRVDLQSATDTARQEANAAWNTYQSAVIAY